MINAKKITKTPLTEKQICDSGMAFVLICLIISFIGQSWLFVKLATLALLINMVYPDTFKPFASVWLRLGNSLGEIVSKVVMAIIFIIVITPIAFVKRSLGNDTLKLKEWKKGTKSVFEDKNHKYTANDLGKPY